MATMAKSKRQSYEQSRGNIRELAEDGEITDAERDAILEFLDAKDPEAPRVTDPNDSTKSDGTLYSYAYGLKRTVQLADFSLIETTPDELNMFYSEMKRGNLPSVKDDGLTKGTVANYQKAIRKFYEYHSDLGIDKDDLFLYKIESGSVDERDIFDKEDIQALRDACEHPRDRAFVDLLLYTGQRVSAILNLRIKDINLEEGTFYLNEEAGDLKGADGKKPLLYAEKAVRNWLRSHPRKNDPDAHLICQKAPNRGQHDYEQGTRIDTSTVYTVLGNIKERAGVDKPVNPHNFRHSFVTVAARDYDMDFDTIKRIIGHKPGSNVMESTYTHLSDEDVIEQARQDMDIEEKDDESPLTPDICENCDEPVPIDNAKACPSCGIAFTPDAQSAQDKIQQDVGAAKVLSGDDISDEDLEAIAQDDALLAKLIEMRSE